MRGWPKNPPRKKHRPKRRNRRKRAEAQPEPQPTRPNQVRASSGRLADSGGMEAQQALANDLLKQNRANVAMNQSAQPVRAEKQSGKDRLAADLAEAKEGRAAVNQERDAGHAPAAQGQQKDNAPAAPEKQSGKELSRRRPQRGEGKRARARAGTRSRAEPLGAKRRGFRHHVLDAFEQVMRGVGIIAPLRFPALREHHALPLAHLPQFVRVDQRFLDARSCSSTTTTTCF